MTGKSHTLFKLGLLIGLILVLASLLLVSGQSAKNVLAAPMDAQADNPQTMDNAACLTCHSRPDSTATIGDTTVSITIDPGKFGGSVHGAQGMACTTCHSNITGFPHPAVDATTYHDYMVSGSQNCQQCHADQFTELADSIHKSVAEGGNEQAPVCTDCHNPHTQTLLRDMATGKAMEEERVSIPLTCAKCHNAIYNEYLDSVHGEGLLKEGNTDSPTCTDCHGVHSIQTVDSSFRLRSPQICAECHTNEDMMKKYGLSTAVMNTYVADFHGTTVTIFEKTAPDQETNTPVCVDCHGFHDITSTKDPEKGIQVKENLVKTCQKCHPDADESFSESWLSHYIPSPTKAPLVYYVNLFYKILIPTVIGGMIIYVLTDIVRRQIDKRKGAKNS